MELPDLETGRVLDFEIDQAACFCRNLLGLYDEVKKSVAAGAPAAILYQHMEEMRQVDRHASDCGDRIRKLASQTGTVLKDHPGFLEFQDIVAQTLEENRRVMRHVLASMAIAKDDIERMRSGKQALCGYHSRGGAKLTGARINCGA